MKRWLVIAVMCVMVPWLMGAEPFPHAAGGGGATTSSGGVTYPSSATDDFAVGGTGAGAAFFVDESQGDVFLNVAGGELDIAADQNDGQQQCLKEGVNDGSAQYCEKVNDAGLTNTMNCVIEDGEWSGDCIGAQLSELGYVSGTPAQNAFVTLTEFMPAGSSGTSAVSWSTTSIDISATGQYHIEWAIAASFEPDANSDGAADDCIDFQLVDSSAGLNANTALMNSVAAKRDSGNTGANRDSLGNQPYGIAIVVVTAVPVSFSLQSRACQVGSYPTAVTLNGEYSWFKVTKVR